MEKEEKEPKYNNNARAMYYMPEYNPPYYRERGPSSMYMEGGNSGGNSGSRGGGGGNSGGGSGGSRGYHDKMIPYGVEEYERMKDPEEGRSGWRRKMYMDGKRYHDKNKQMQELEAYMMELTRDMTEMIEDASPEEKTLLQ